MDASSTFRGTLPTRESTATAICFAMKCLDKAAAMEKPPSSSMVTCAGGEGGQCQYGRSNVKSS
eukprot:1137785-Pelagomonas_calceolata.AAC.9